MQNYSSYRTHISVRQRFSSSSLPAKELKIQWFPQWSPILDEAVRTLVGAYDYPLELYRLLCQNQGLVKKRFGLISQDGEPVGIAGLRNCQRHWEPVTQWLLPGRIFPIQAGCLPQTLDKIGLDLWLGWWRSPQLPLRTKNVRYLAAKPTHKMSCGENPEEYWRATGKFKSVRLSRNRCRSFTWGINLPGSAEWTIRNWNAKWGQDQEDLNLSDRLLIAHFLEDLGLHYTLSILDQGDFIASATVMVHGSDLVAGVNYRRQEYNWYGVGDRLLDLIFSWAAERRYQTFDLGGGQNYKGKWAPQDGEQWIENICPGHIYHVKRLVHWLQELVKRPPVTKPLQ